MKPRVLILTGYGINCDHETQHVFNICGANAMRVHVNDLLHSPSLLHRHQLLVIPGGFSFGDDLGSGKALAVRLASQLMPDLKKFIDDGKLLLGICNGFQVLVKMGLLPGTGSKTIQDATLTFNKSGIFEDRWVYVKSNPRSPCIYTRSLDRLYLPVRHGEGRFVFRDAAVRRQLFKNNQIVLRYVDARGKAAGYPHNPNGSDDNIAGVCDPSGRIFGLMPHPEAFFSPLHHPRWTRSGEWVVPAHQIFSNAVEYMRKHVSSA